VAIANALQLETARATSAFPRFNYDAIPSLTSLNLSINCLVIAFLRLTTWPWPLTLWPWPLTFDLEHLQRVSSQWRDETLYQIWTQSNNPRRSYCDLHHPARPDSFKAHWRQYCFVHPMEHDLALSWLFRPL